jgi:hypothetical protein
MKMIVTLFTLNRPGFLPEGERVRVEGRTA